MTATSVLNALPVSARLMRRAWPQSFTGQNWRLKNRSKNASMNETYYITCVLPNGHNTPVQGRRQRILKAGAEGVLDHGPGELRNFIYIYTYIYVNVANLEIFLF